MLRVPSDAAHEQPAKEEFIKFWAIAIYLDLMFSAFEPIEGSHSQSLVSPTSTTEPPSSRR
jgi:hypothetical protein